MLSNLTSLCTSPITPMILTLLSFLITGCCFRSPYSECHSPIIKAIRIFRLYCSTMLVIAAAFIAIYFEYYAIIHSNIDIKEGGTLPIIANLFPWFDVGGLNINFKIYLDKIAIKMTCIILIVSSLVHLYSLTYMQKDPALMRFMSYLSLFTFFMLILVSSGDFLQLFLGWEGVGLCSYLLIGFWFHKESANIAAMKAFIVNRIGDIGLALGIFGIFKLFGTLDFDIVLQKVKTSSLTEEYFTILGFDFHALSFICALLFVGCMGKSAQILLHVWLPDAMEGPTPVSALIHAATMVTAGVFLVIRCSPLFQEAELILSCITVIGATTSIFAATIALVQNDIKKIIAYSTCSQLGYMFFACGVSGFQEGFMHLITHAFFKALLFLGAGSIIYAMHHEKDIRKISGNNLKQRIPFVYIMMLIGSLALAGIPPFAGFFSKEAILEAAYVKESWVADFAYYVGLLVAALTSFYSWRLLIVVFSKYPIITHNITTKNVNDINNTNSIGTVNDAYTFDTVNTANIENTETEENKSRSRDKLIIQNPLHQTQKLHQISWQMKCALAVLALGSILCGWWLTKGYNILLEQGEEVEKGSGLYINLFLPLHLIALYKDGNFKSILIEFLPTICSLSGIACAYAIYHFKIIHSSSIQNIFRNYTLILNKGYYFDDIYNYLITKFKALSAFFWQTLDQKTIDSIPNGLASITMKTANFIRNLHSGKIYHYLTIMLIMIFFLLYLAVI